MASNARFRGELSEFVSSCGGSKDVSLTVNRSNSVLSRLSKNNFSPKINKNHPKFPSSEIASVTNFLDNNVPRVVGTRAAHNGGQNGIGGIDVSLSFRQFTDDGIVDGGYSVKDAVDTLQRLLVFDVDAIVALVVILQLPAATKVFACKAT